MLCVFVHPTSGCKRKHKRNSCFLVDGRSLLCSSQIFLWVGNLANKAETKDAWISAREYLQFHPAGRDPDTPIIFIKQGHEPLTFTGWFNAWDPQKWSVSGD